MLTPGDSVRVVVWRRPEFSGDFVVAPNGTITHPLYRSVTIGGVPFATAEANLRRFLSRFADDELRELAGFWARLGDEGAAA